MSASDYQAVRAAAQAHANASGRDQGVYRVHGGFSSMGLPRRENRYGWERSCEVVSCETLAKCLDGHGPIRAR